MKILLVSIALAFGSAGCLGTFIPGNSGPSPSPDLAPAASSADVDMAEHQSGDMAKATSSSDDMGGVAAASGTAAFGALCTVNGDCQSNICDMFAMGKVHRCTKMCTVATQANDCPAPSDGTCDPNTHCKFDN